MATISSAALAPPLSLNLSRKITPLSSSSSVFFRAQNSSNRAVFGLSVARSGKAQKRGLSCTCLFGLGVPELVVIAGVAALVFGPKKLPEVGKSIGKTVKSFQQAAKEFESELKKDGDVEDPPSEKVAPVSEEEKQEIQASSTKESS